MTIKLPMATEEHFTDVEHQGKQIKVGDIVLVREAGTQKSVAVSSIVKKQDHYWVGYNDNARYCPWPLVQVDG